MKAALPSLMALALSLATNANAQTMPQPSDDPRIQSVVRSAGEPIVLPVEAGGPLTLLFAPGEQVVRFEVADQNQVDARVSSGGDGVVLYPLRAGLDTVMIVDTDRDAYRFYVQSGMGVLTPSVVQIGEAVDPPEPDGAIHNAPPLGATLWSYRVRGDREVRPATLTDNGHRTWIGFADGQALPAVFAIGPTGKEEVVNGHMRGRFYVIDRVYERLVFRIDREKASARRLRDPERADG